MTVWLLLVGCGGSSQALQWEVAVETVPTDAFGPNDLRHWAPGTCTGPSVPDRERYFFEAYLRSWPRRVVVDRPSRRERWTSDRWAATHDGAPLPGPVRDEIDALARGYLDRFASCTVAVAEPGSAGLPNPDPQAYWMRVDCPDQRVVRDLFVSDPWGEHLQAVVRVRTSDDADPVELSIAASPPIDDEPLPPSIEGGTYQARTWPFALPASWQVGVDHEAVAAIERAREEMIAARLRGR